MKTIIIIWGCISVATFLFIWAACYVGSGGKVPIFKRRTNK